MTAARPRIEWMDVIKATAVIVIVLSHAVDLLAPVAGGQPAQTFWQVFMTILEPMRMPLFFMISGMLAASALNRPWNKVRQRTWGMVYLYVLWSVIFFAVVACYVRAPIGEQLLTYLKLILIAG
ncbi:MAG: acyltransferase family protein, partial [Methylococcaceae bacterium]